MKMQQNLSKAHILAFFLFLLLTNFSSTKALAPRPPPKKQVIVTGAAGRTGQIVFSSLLQHTKYYPVGLVRTESSAKKLIQQTHCGLEQVWVCDVTSLDENDHDHPHGINDAEAMVICTSAVPIMKKRSLLKAFLKIPLNVIKGNKAFEFRQLEFCYRDGQYPEKVDYEGQIAQIDLAKKIGIKHVILVSSMGGTDPNDFLNTLGKNKNGEGNGDILIWKRKAEKYLIDSGLQYTIIHPGGLKDTPCGERNIEIDVDDNLRKRVDLNSRSISRCDVARLCIASLENDQSSAFDCVNVDVTEGSNKISADASLRKFLNSGVTYDYSDMDVIVDEWSI